MALCVERKKRLRESHHRTRERGVPMHLRKVCLFPERYPARGCYPFNQTVFLQTRCIEFESPVTFFVGENGTGKSTLLEAISLQCNIHIWRGMQRRRFQFNAYEKDLFRYLSVEWTQGPVAGSFFSSEIFRSFAESLDDWATSDPGILTYFGGKSLLTQSHGQSLLSFFKARYRIKGLYLLDEPETALSPRSQLGFVRLLKAMADLGHAQFLIASHSPILLACPGAEILSFDSAPVGRIQYEETEHYRVYRAFMEDRRRYLEDDPLSPVSGKAS